MRFSKTVQLWLVILLGLGVRLGFAISSAHLYHPDEIYQSVEQSYRLIKGYGMLPWDVVYGLRSAWVAGFTAIPIGLLNTFNISDPVINLLAIKSFLLLYSIALIPAGYYLVRHLSKNHYLALFIAFTLAVWYELIYFSSRALTESISIDLFALSLICMFGDRRRVFWTTFLITIASLVRIHYFLLAIPILYLIFKKEKPLTAILGILLGVGVYGLCDYVAQGVWLGSLVNNVTLSYASGASEIFGVKPISFYVLSLIGGSAGLILIALQQFSLKKFRIVALTLIVLIVEHLLFPHKEYRFLYGSIPLLIILAGQWLYTRFSKPRVLPYLVISILSLLGLFQKLPLEGYAYPQAPLLKDPYVHIMTTLSTDQTACGIFHDSRSWVYTGGYSLLQKNIPQFDKDHDGNPSNYNVIISQNHEIPKGYYVSMVTQPYQVLTPITTLTIDPYYVYKKASTCKPIKIDYYRSFADIESLLPPKKLL